jgi:hypothetical protein
MSVNEEDEMLGDVDRMVRTGVMAAGMLAERGARIHSERERVALDRARAAAADYERRFVADRDVARAYHQQVTDPAFWEKASPERVAQTFAAAYQWRDHDGQAAVALMKLKEGMAEHHGINVDAVLARDHDMNTIGPLQDQGLAELRTDPAKREFAEQVLGRFVQGRDTNTAAGTDNDDGPTRGVAADPEADTRIEATQQERSKRDPRRDVDEVAENAPADQDRLTAEDAAAQRGRQPAAAPAPAAADREPDPQPGTNRTGRETVAVSAEAQQARDDSAQNFPASAAESLREGHPAARARVVRGASQGADRSRDLGR